MKAIHIALLFLFSLSGFAQQRVGSKGGAVVDTTVLDTKARTNPIFSGLASKDASLSTAVGNAQATASSAVTGVGSLSTAVTSLQAIQYKPVKLNSTVVYFGDSHIAYGYNSGNPYFNNDGLTTWFNLYTGGKLNQPFGANQGVGGNTTTQMIARLGAALAYNPTLVLMQAGGNDVNAGTAAAQIQANIQAIIDAFAAINARVIITTIPKRWGGAAFTTGQETIRSTVNSYILSLASPMIAVVDMASATNASTYFQSDGIHYNSTGAAIAGQLASVPALAWMDNINVTKQLQQDNTFTTNLALTGTTGGKNTSTGNVATSWTLLGNTAGGATVAGSKTTDNNLNQQVITISGTYTGSNKYAGLLSNFASTSLVAGTYTESFLDFEVLSTLTNVAGVSISTTYNGASGYISDSYSWFPNDANPMTLAVGRYQLRGVPFVVPAGVTSVDTNVAVQLVNTATSLTAAASIKIHKAGSIVVK